MFSTDTSQQRPQDHDGRVIVISTETISCHGSLMADYGVDSCYKYGKSPGGTIEGRFPE